MDVKPLVSGGEYSFVSYIWHYGIEKEFQSVLNIYGKKSTHFENGFSKWVDLVPNLKFEKKPKSNLVSNVRCKWYHIDILRCFKYGIFILFLFARKKNRFCPVTPSSV